MYLPLILALGLFAGPALVYAVSCSDDPAYTVYNATICETKSSSASGSVSGDEDTIINKHNDLRSAVATAANMQKAVWDQDLSDFAQALVDQCEGNHDEYEERRLRGDYNQGVGQNMATAYGGSRTWEEIIILWHNEVENFTYNAATTNDGKQNGNVVGHYTQVVYADTARIGCGYAVCDTTHYFACNYILGNGMGEGSIATPYKTDGLCSNCKKCTDNLCDCGGLFCYNGGTLDLTTCTCSCFGVFTGDDCTTKSCPPIEFQSTTTCVAPLDCIYMPQYQAECPYTCGICAESEAPSCADWPTCHKSEIYGCVYNGVQRTAALCAGYGNSGDDNPTICPNAQYGCDYCTSMETFPTAYCPKKCAICPD